MVFQTLLNFLLLVVVPQGNVAQPTKCCGSKTVGGYSYSLIDTNAITPSECLNSCVYSKDMEPGSMYCFGRGQEAVTCQGEKSISLCYPGGVCTGPDFDIRIIGEPSYISLQSSFQDCYQYCRSLCYGIFCECEAWTWDGIYCFAYSGLCYETEYTPGFVSGSVCFDSDDAPINILTEEQKNASRVAAPDGGPVGPLGYLTSHLTYFTDWTAAKDNGDITQVTVYTDKPSIYFNSSVVVGIEVTYGVVPFLHGKRSNTSFTVNQNSKLPINGVFGISKNTKASNAYIFQLGFYLNNVKKGPVGEKVENLGSKIQNGGPYMDGTKTPTYQLKYINGYLTHNNILTYLRFYFKPYIQN